MVTQQPFQPFKDINVHTIQASIIIDRAGRLKAVFYGALFPL